MAKGKKKFEIETPRGVIYTQATKGGKVSARTGIRTLNRIWNLVSQAHRSLLIPNASGV